jgi:hypothetical protein
LVVGDVSSASKLGSRSRFCARLVDVIATLATTATDTISKLLSRLKMLLVTAITSSPAPVSFETPS